MKIVARDVDEIQSPIKEWNWYRTPTAFDSAAANAYVLGARVGSKTYAWHANGSPLTISGSKPVQILEWNCETEAQALCLWLTTASQISPIGAAEGAGFVRAFAKLSGTEVTGLKSPLAFIQTPIWNEWKRAAALDDEELRWIHERGFDPEEMAELTKLTRESREAFMHAVKPHSMNAIVAREILDHALAIVKKFGPNATLSVLAARYSSLDELRTALFRIGTPEVSSMADERISKLRALAPPPRTAVHGDPGFEHEGIKITHTPRNINDLDFFIAWLMNDETQERLRDLLHVRQQ